MASVIAIMRGKWAAGIPPRNFTWVIKDQLGMSERPGGYSATHRRVRRQEELIWLQVQGFNHVISLIPSPHNLAAYQEKKIPYTHIPLSQNQDQSAVLLECYEILASLLEENKKILIHQEELGERTIGLVAGYLVWAKKLPNSQQSVAFMEQLVGRQLGTHGRELAMLAEDLTEKK